MTNWQKSCIEALVNGEDAFALFKAKQKNKRHLDQYINKLWPFRKKEITVKGNQELELRSMMMQITRALNSKEFIGDPLDVASIKIEFKIPVKLEELIRDLRFLFAQTEKICTWKLHTIDIRMFASSSDYFRVSQNDSSRYILDNFISELRGLYGVSMQSISFTAISSDLNIINSAKEFIKMLKSLLISNKNKGNRSYYGQNVGIEIEYEGVWLKKLKGSLLNKGAVSFDSGIDGSNIEGNDLNYSNSGRLRENRLRLNGARSLFALEHLAREMKSNCSITTNSGMHYHIDFRDSFSPLMGRDGELFLRRVRQKIVDAVDEISTENKTIINAIKVFSNGENSNKEALNLFQTQLKYHNEFCTVEFRMGTPTLNFKVLAIEILAAIHLSNSFREVNKTNINNKYVEYLLELKKQAEL